MDKNTNGIYKFENKINHKIYIGQANNLSQRYKKHKNNINDISHQEIFYRALRKYGWDNFEYEILEEFYDYDKERLNKLEIYYIKKYNSLNPNGYNMTKGGHFSSENIKVPIRQYSLEGKFLKEYESISEIIRQLNLSTTSEIILCCKGKRNQSAGFQWRYAKDNIEELDDIFNKCFITNTPILQYDIYGNFIKEYSSLEEACKVTNLNKSSLCQALKHKNNIAYNFQWRYKNDNTPVENLDKTVLQLDKENNIIKEFINATVASKVTRIHRGNIGECLQNKRKTAGGYRWIYKKDYYKNEK